jgi:hypothetical protein
MVPGATGLNITLGGRDTSFSFPLVIDDRWATERCHVIAFLQKTGTGYNVIQAAKTPLFARPDYAFRLTAEASHRLISPSASARFTFTLRNDGTMTDNYVISRKLTTPGGWSARFSSDIFPDFDSTSISVPAMTTMDFYLNVNPGGISGEGSVDVIVRSTGLSTSDTITFGVVTPRDILLVNASGDAWRGDFYRSMLTELGREFVYWDIASYGQLNEFAAAGFNKVIWFTGYSSDPVSAASRLEIRNFLTTHGGKFLLSGNINGTYISSDFNFFFQGLGCMFVIKKFGMTNALAVTGNPVTVSSSIPLSGDSTEAIATYGTTSRAFLKYSDHTLCGIVNTPATGGRTVNLSFDLSNSPSAGSARNLMRHILSWLETGNSISENENLPLENGISSLGPNPFNGAVSIDFSIREEDKGSFSVYDNTGKLVKDYGEFQRGSHRVLWTPENDMPSGIYLFRLKTDSATSMVKAVYLK